MATETITICGQTFTVPLRYAEGHVLTAGEASALNKTFHENIRNNIAGKIRAKDSGVTLVDEKSLPEALVAEWQTKVTEYASTYAFGVRTGVGRGPAMDPETREAMRLAGDAVKVALKKKGTLKQYTPEAIRDAAKRHLDGPNGERTWRLAKQIVRQQEEAAKQALEMPEAAE